MLRGMVAGHKKPDQTEVLYSGNIGGDYPFTITHSLTRQCIMVDCDYYEIGHFIMSDRNLGATAYMGETGKTTSDWYGKYYQWGNNFGFTPPVSNKTATKVDPTGYGPGNYYSSSTFVTDDYYNRTIFTYPASINDLRGVNTNTNEARRGPCDAGFHVPTYDELYLLEHIVMQLGNTDAALATMRIPKAGRIEQYGFYGRGSYVYLWGADRDDGGYGYELEPGRYNNYEFSYGSGSTYSEYACYGMPIRAFSNSVVEPEGPGWVLVAGIEEGWTGTVRVRENTTLGLITAKTDYFGDWRTITIQNKNVGATQVYNSGDTLSDTNCGRYFQRGNNYGFPSSGYSSSDTLVDVTGYSWQNPFSRNVYVRDSSDLPRWKATYDNIRGGTAQGYIAKQGPCPSGWHIPTGDELYKIHNVIYFLIDAGLTYDEACAKLLLPKSGYVSASWREEGTLVDAGNRFDLWGCDSYIEYGDDEGPAIYDSDDDRVYGMRVCHAYSIRPFRNT